MERIREWSFPVIVICAWLVAGGYTLASLAEAHARAAAVKSESISVPAAAAEPRQS
jgi:hypothetical protein